MRDMWEGLHAKKLLCISYLALYNYIISTRTAGLHSRLLPRSFSSDNCPRMINFEAGKGPLFYGSREYLTTFRYGIMLWEEALIEVHIGDSVYQMKEYEHISSYCHFFVNLRQASRLSTSRVLYAAGKEMYLPIP